MIKTFTPNDVVLYLYKETSERENSDLESAMLCQADLLDQYVQLVAIKELLDKVRKTPSETIIQQILDYSNSYDPILS